MCRILLTTNPTYANTKSVVDKQFTARILFTTKPTYTNISTTCWHILEYQLITTVLIHRKLSSTYIIWNCIWSSPPPIQLQVKRDFGFLKKATIKFMTQNTVDN
ncbi:uncharacterized protein LOC124206361 [Daphnia pulex]|uniref:uncharacterized protein LOC124206361 n=1 Tax=Daphnia pulex TaxID=6669 RepID=UPI001EDEE02B|nr:uncharacterized protein LOC124206361 [Daphnia pulex]XP_046460104.1 uncharacterized protein LOC124206361 [Daphnia pulex]XP_046651234.1 uncharacterized protein LOC124342309 [Daphnia pulicaria]